MDCHAYSLLRKDCLRGFSNTQAFGRRYLNLTHHYCSYTDDGCHHNSRAPRISARTLDFLRQMEATAK